MCKIKCKSFTLKSLNTKKAKENREDCVGKEDKPSRV